MHDHGAMEKCAERCHECQDECLAAITHCLKRGGEHANLEHLTALIDCAAICGVSHSLLHRHSPFHMHTCRASAEICSACASKCSRLADEDELMKQCAQACRECASECEHMAGSASGSHRQT